MTDDELQAETLRKANEKLTQTVDTVTAQLKNVKPLTPEQMDEMAKQVHETDPDLIRADVEIKQMQIINSIFEKGDRKQ